MNLRTTCTALATMGLLLTHHMVVAADSTIATESHASSKSKLKVASVERPLIDINSANAVELATLPGIGDPEAQKIIDNRPYSTKAQLVVRHIVEGAVYEGLRKKIIAKQPFKDAAKNAAIYVKQK